MKPFSPIEGFLTVNEEGHLAIDGLDSVELARKYGTPLYVVSEKRIRENYRRCLRAFKSRYPNTEIFYALKANPLLAVCRILQQEGAGFEVGGPGELYIAGLLGVAPNKVSLNGNNKSREELRSALNMGAIINIDSTHELDVLHEEASKLGKRAKIAFRVTPDVPPGRRIVHPELWTGLRESKFGIDIQSGLAYRAYEKAIEMNGLDVVGIHTHIGSPVEETEAYEIATERIMEFVGTLKKRLDIDLEFINMGGGFAIPFKYKEGLPTLEDYAESIIYVLKEKADELDLGEPKLLIEPGGSIVGDTTVLLLRVGMIKGVPGLARWVAVDGGANVILRASQGWYVYQFVAANKMLEKSVETVNVAGPLCYSGDVLAVGRDMPHLDEGDILAALDAGAYTFTYEFHGAGSHPLPAIVLVSDGRDELIRRPETLTDIVSKDIIPLKLAGLERHE